MPSAFPNADIHDGVVLVSAGFQWFQNLEHAADTRRVVVLIRGMRNYEPVTPQPLDASLDFRVYGVACGLGALAKVLYWLQGY